MHWVGGGGLMSGKGTKNLQVMCESICMNVVVFFFIPIVTLNKRVLCRHILSKTVIFFNKVFLN